MNSKVWITMGVLALAAVVGAGAFVGGMSFERLRAANIRSSFLAGRGADGNGGTGAGGVGGAGAGGNTVGRVVGQIKSINGDTLEISTPFNVTTVTLTDATIINKLAEGTRADLKVGDSINVRGEPGPGGTVTADSIQLLGANGFGAPQP